MQDRLDPSVQAVADEERKLSESEQQKQEDADILWLMSERQGRRIVYDLLAKTGVFRGSYNGDSNGTIFNEGKREVGLFYLSKVNEFCRDEFILMLKEHEDDVDRASRRTVKR